jgi:regulator of protease activity HflC (stomatin/prohibitin superfamily)
MKVYLIALLTAVVLVAAFGYVGPALFSARSYEAVGVGVAILAVLPIFGIALFRVVRKNPKVKKFMKNLCIVSVLALSVIACDKVPAGNVGLKVHLLGGDKGVDTEELGPGRYWIGWNTDLFVFPTFTQNYVWTKDPTEGSPNDESIDFQSKEGLTFNGDFGISYAVKPGAVSKVFQKYRRKLDEVTDTYLRNMVRDGLNQYASTQAAEDIYGSKKNDMMKFVEEFVRAQVDELLIVENVYLIGSLRLPTKVLDAMNEKMAATQRAQQRENEIREARAAAEKAVAEAEGQARSTLMRAEAEAKSNTMVAKSLTPELVQWKALQTWDGKLPQYTGGGAVPFINIK